MDSALIDQPNDITIGRTSTSKALFIAEILAGCAAAILVIAIVCCFCSRAARRRFQHGSIAEQDPFPLPNGGEMRETGRQTPDAAPAYSTTSPLGPLSPEVVDAISRVSADCRHSLVVSILSSAQSIHSPQIQIGSRQPSNISSIDIESPRLLLGSPSIRSTAASVRSSMTNERLSWDATREASENGDLHRVRTSPWLSHHRTASNPPANLIEQIRQAPPSYDPAWRESLHIPPHRGRHHRPLRNSRDRSTPLIQLDQEYTYGPEATREELIVPVQAWPHRRTGSFNTPSHGMPAHMFTSTYQRGPPGEPLRSSSRRSISWTGAIIRLGSAYSGSHHHHHTNPPTNRSHLSSSWLPQPADTPPSSSRRNSEDTTTVDLQQWQQDQDHQLSLNNDSTDNLYPPPPEYVLPAEQRPTTDTTQLLDDVSIEPITIESLQREPTDLLHQ
ncbi:hypothetical protein BG015_008281 [Linnemannia schmuckeri]|uniref:Uncharacterized protein n=1 Tax=Linnemannia schmuckeri TaxID=64567 RepID=A0A9P5S0M9_9FUNG|nr:hypothetical protein BG015_008281 [Linnemannia schmuckeri]